MKGQFLSSRLILGMALALIASYAEANNCCNPLANFFECGSWAYQFRGGVYPTLWRSRGDIFLDSCDCTTNTPGASVNLGQLGKFSDYFKLPFVVGSQLIYETNNCFSLYGEVNFIQGSPKRSALNTTQSSNANFALRFGHYRAVSGYVGLFYDVADFCNSTLFVGAKIGGIYHSNIYAHQVVASPEVNCICDEVVRRMLFKHGLRVSGGVSLGLDYNWCNCWNLVLMGEAVFSGGPKGACAPLLSSEIVALVGGSALSTRTIKTEISFPVTLGLMYSF